MTDETERSARRRQARQDARKLAELAQAIAGTIDAERARALAQEANRLASSIRLALAKAHDPQSELIKQVVAEGLEPVLQAYAAQLAEVLGGAGFALLVFVDGLTNYVSNCARDDIVAAMQEFIAMHERSRIASATGIEVTES